VIIGAILIAGIGVAVVTSGGDDDDDRTETTTTTQADGSTTTSEGETTTTSEGETTTTTEGTTTTVGTQTSGTIPEDGSDSIEVTIQPGTTGTLTVTPDPNLDVVVEIVDGPSRTGERVDVGLSGEEETLDLEEGVWTVEVSGFLGAEGSYDAELT